jgi:hypothetical protein
MRRLVSFFLPLMMALVAASILAPSAAAKGPTQAVLTGPGITDPIMLKEPDSPTIGPVLSDVVMDSGFFYEAWANDGPRGHLMHRPAGDLGPRYTITYTMSLGSNRSDDIVQYVYPYARPRPVTSMPPGQEFWGTSETTGGWYSAPFTLKRTLITAGLPQTAPVEASSTSRGTVAESELRNGSPALLVWILVAVAAIVLVTFVQRRRGRSNAVTP